MTEIAPDMREASSTTKQGATFTTALAALGIVFGDLGTSPLYTYQTIVSDVGGRPSVGDALGLLSLVVWTLIVTISIKYCIFVMRADNHGEGGILALMSLVAGRAGRAAPALIAVGLFGAALIYGDGIITPAISVLSALEGINVVTTIFKPYVMPAALLILFALFAVQTFGTARIGRFFGPIMLLWFATIAVLGFLGLVQRPEVLAAIDPRHGVDFLVRHGWRSFIVLGGVFLAITGGEALYADMGSIGRRPIRLSWYGLVLPALLLSYAGQTALLIKTPNLIGNPFFKLAPGWAVVSARLPRDHCHHHCEPSHYHRGLFPDPTGHAARLVSRSANPPDLRQGVRPDLCALGELDDDDWHARTDLRLWELGPACGRLRHGCLDHNASHHRSPLQRHARPLAVAEMDRAPRKWRLSGL
jgi:K+ transporter